ncbi:hypothetical protein CAEBREN_00550 [Caenorhabditis brenneri]|uniref:Uncharacterized protein n=1 Tax=Caenorhabditis brenneri TaxID=135651 RepID=G0NGQ4_CAEBE|nr:hypothetical protein CAEBREN_00550 [Caenorhabditis brenneri]
MSGFFGRMSSRISDKSLNDCGDDRALLTIERLQQLPDSIGKRRIRLLGQSGLCLHITSDFLSHPFFIFFPRLTKAARRGSGPVQRELNGREIGVVEVAAGIVRRNRGAQGGAGGAQGVGGGGGDQRGDGGENGGGGGGANAAVIVTDGGRGGQQGGGTVNARGKTMEERKSLLKRDPVPRNLAINVKERRNSFWDHTPSFFSLYMMWIISFNTLKRDANGDFGSKYWHDVWNCAVNCVLLLAMLFCNFVGNEKFPSSKNGFFRFISVFFHQGSQITLATTALAAILPSIPSFYAVYQGQEAYIENEGFSGETPFFASFGFYIIAGALLIETARR